MNRNLAWIELLQWEHTFFFHYVRAEIFEAVHTKVIQWQNISYTRSKFNGDFFIVPCTGKAIKSLASTPEYVAAILVMAKSLMAQRCLNEFAENID